MPLESLMYGWRLMQPAGYGFKIMDRECPWIMKTVPAHKIKRVCAVDVRIDQSLFFDQYLKVAFFIVRLQVFGLTDVALTIRRVFHQLAIAVHIPFWRTNRAKAFYNKQAVSFGIKFH